MIGRMTRVMLFVKDVPKVAAFYRDILGLKVVGKIDPAWTELKAGACNVALHKAPKSQKERGPSPVKICFGVKDVAAAKKLIESRGGKMRDVHTSPGLSLCDGFDPEGNLFQLSSRGM